MPAGQLQLKVDCLIEAINLHRFKQFRILSKSILNTWKWYKVSLEEMSCNFQLSLKISPTTKNICCLIKRACDEKSGSFLLSWFEDIHSCNGIFVSSKNQNMKSLYANGTENKIQKTELPKGPKPRGSLICED